MIDNWTLQDVELLLSRGLSPRTASEISISKDRNDHSFSPIPEGVLQIDALLSLLTNLVCFGQLIVDARFLNTWQKPGAQLAPLANLGVVTATDYTEFGKDLVDLRESIVDELCVTSTLQESMRLVREEWQKNQTATDPHLSALVWGGAGMLARSHLTEVPYFGHPVRRHLLEQSLFFPRISISNAGQAVTSFLETERAKMFRFRSQRMAGSVGHISLPPLAVQVIEEADCLEQLIPTAINLRERHSELRAWLASYQAAIDEENESKQMKHERLLRDLSRSLQNRYGADSGGSTGISISVAFIQGAIPRAMVDRLVNSFGVRSTLSKLVLAPRGQKAMKRLLTMLGENNSSLGRRLLPELHSRYSVEGTSSAR
jgi:hypothetical protein